MKPHSFSHGEMHNEPLFFARFSLGRFFEDYMYILNQVPNNSVLKTPYELMTKKKPSLRYLHVWGHKAWVRPYNPYLKKLDPTIVSNFFIGCCVSSRGSRFYYHSHFMWVIEFDRAIFFENDLDSGSHAPWLVTFREDRVVVPMPTISLPIYAVITVAPDDNQILHEDDNVAAPLIIGQGHDDTVEEVPLQRS